MLGNLKDFLSVVQDGLTSNSNLRQTLQEVQKVKNIFKDKQKVHFESKVNYSVGAELLEKYQEEWAELHENADNNAKAADDVDKLILELHEVTKNRLQTAQELGQSLSHLPNLTASVAQCMESLRNVEELLNTVEEELLEFEDIVERSNMEKWKLDHHYQLSIYKEKKMASLDDIRSNLAKENAQKSIEQERRQLTELQARRETSAMAFKQDVAKYLASGNIPSGPPASPKMTLDQVQLDNDRNDLEDFLNS